jgi:hypothetical protein
MLPGMPPGASPPGAGAGGAPGAGGGQGPELLRICAGDEDWFVVTAKPDQKQVVSIGFDHARGDLDLALYAAGATATDEPLELSARSSAAAGAEGLALPEVDEETPYLLRVFAPAGANNFYLLQVSSPQGGGGGDDQQDPQDQQDQKDQDQQDQQQEQEQQAQQPEQRDGMEELMDQLDRNPRNLEAERALRQSPFRDARPARPW